MRKAPVSRWFPGASRTTMAALLLAVPIAARAQGFAGIASVSHGSASISGAGNVQTVAIPTSSPVTTINWTPTDTATSPNPINFLPSGQTVNYIGAAGASTPYTVLNRIIPTDTTRAIGFNGAVTSTANTRVWFYSPGGLLIGSTATFNVGGLVLTAADPVTDEGGNFMPTFDQFSVAAAAGSTSAITIQPGASIKALNSAQSNYVVAIAPQIKQGGAISVAGSVALVAAESATFAVDSQGLFNITVNAGTTVANNTFVHTGSTGGPNTAAQTGYSQRVYMVAVPKNNAITMAISSGGSIGFAVADAANIQGNEIVLSAGSNIADTGSGSPVVAGSAGTGVPSLTVGAGSYTSNTYAVSTGAATITDPAANITFASDLTLIAPTATVNAQVGTISVGGDLNVMADSGVNGAPVALVQVASGAALEVGANAAALGVNGDLTVSADDALFGLGGSATLQANGTVGVAGNALVSAQGLWGSSLDNPGTTITQGGTAQVSVTGGQLTVGGSLTANAIADATGANAALATSASQYYDSGATAQGGTASVTVSGTAATLMATGGIAARAGAISSVDQNGYGGSATGGTALIEAESGGAMSVGQSGAIAAAANAAPGVITAQPNETYSYGGSSNGGTAQVIANAGTITVAGVNGITALANATGGSALSSFSGSGGSASGGIALIATQGSGASIATNTSGASVQSDYATLVEANATGGDAQGYGSYGGQATGGSATLQVTGAGQSITVDHGNSVMIGASAVAGTGAGYNGGSANGGTAQLLASGGSIGITNASLTIGASAAGGSQNNGDGGYATGGAIQFAASSGGSINAEVATNLNASATGGNSASGIGGNATGGTVQFTATSGGTIASAAPYISASATGGNGSSTGGNALGGNIFITESNNAIDFDASGSPELDASYTAGAGAGGSPATASSAGGVLLTDQGALTLGGALTIDGNTQFYAQSDGSINVTGSIAGTGAGAYLHLWSDDLGTGTGTVTLANGALNLPGNLIDIYYNPASIGTPTDFSAGVTAGTLTAYQLVDNVQQLQQVGSYLTQNFALGKNIDASATQGWNAGAGFVPIGTFGSAFTGNFDGLNHTITGLYIDTPNGNYAGLFGDVETSAANLVIRNLGLVNAQVTGSIYVGGLIGYSSNVSISNSYVTASAVSATGYGYVGGLIGDAVNTAVLTNVHSDAAVSGSGSPTAYVGGLVGSVQNGTITDVFSTGSVSAPSANAVGVGGLIGIMGSASLSQAYSTASVATGNSSIYVGGLIGSSSGPLNQTYATGAVTVGSGANSVGGLVGNNGGTISESWASGAVTAASSSNVGGFAGYNEGSITNSYWDSYSTGQAAGIGTDVGTTTQLNSVTSDPSAQSGPTAFYSYNYANFTPGDWLYDDYSTRPIGAWEKPVAQFGVATVSSAHQVQLIDFNMGGNYRIAQNIDMSGTSSASDIWAPGGFLPLGGEYVDPPFTGTLAGAGHVLSNIAMAQSPDNYPAIGFIEQNEGAISDLGLANINITATTQYNYQPYYSGTIAGINSGRITDSFATGTLTLGGAESQIGVAGGLVGLNTGGGTDGAFGTITRSYATVAVTGGATVGGLVGTNEGAISETFANGMVSGVQAGGLVGSTADSDVATITNSYWDTELSGQGLGCGSGPCGGITGLTTAQTLLAESFPEFAIDTTGGQGLPWRQYEGLTTPLLEAFLTPITVQPGSLTTQYNAQAPDIGVTTYGAQPSLTFGTAQVNGLTRNAGVSYITYGGGLYSNQIGYDFVPSGNPGTLVITPAPLTLAAVTDTKVYDATTNSAGLPSVSGIYGEDSVTSLTQGFTSKNVMGANGSTLVVNSGYVINDGNGGNNYTVTVVSAPGTITPAPLTLAAVSDTKVYDGTISSAPTPQASGLFGEDNVTSLTQSFTSKNVMGTNASTLAVNAGYLVNDGNNGANYTVTLQNAAGTITPAALAITYTATPATSTYGTTPSGLTGTVSDQGLQGGDTLAAVTSGTASFTTTATAQSNVGSYAITGSGLAGNSNNYTFSFAQAPGNATALTITAASLTVDVLADPESRSYGAANPPLTYTETGLANGDMLTGSLATTATPTSNVGVYAITQGTLSAGSNYTLSYTGANLTVTPASLTVTYTANLATSIYGNTPSGLSGSVTPTGLVLGQTLGSVTSGTAVFTTPATARSPVGSYAITGSGLAANSSNYSFSFVQAPGNAAALTIDPAALLVAANAQSRTYGASNPVLTYTDTGLVNGDTLTGSLATTATPASNVGAYAITQGTLSAGSNYTLSYTGSNLTINPASLTVTYTANPATSIYGNTPSGLSGSVTPTGLVLGQTLGSVTSGSAVFTTPATAQSSVGSYAITGSGLAANSNNYSFSFVQAPGNATALAIDPAALLVAADAQSRTYGASNPALTYTDTGLVNGDTLTGSLATTATPASNVGAYAITQGTLSAGSNYTLSYTGANLTVTPASLTVTYTANPLTSIYGTVPSGLSGSVTPTGLVLGQTLGSVTSGSAVFTTPATARSPVGSYAITGSGLAANSSNYSFSFVQAPGNATALTIDPAALLVAADAQSRTYGASNPALTYTDTGLVNGDTLTGSLATTATPASNVGNYAITQGTLTAGSNYTLSYTGANLTINPASLTVTYTANPATSIYGNTPSGLSGSESASGLVNSDTLASVTSGTASFTTPATAQSPVGSYAITGSGLAANSSNYSFSFVQAPGNATALAIDPAALLVAADAQSRTYGASNPALTYTDTGLVNGDTLTGNLATGATPASNVGAYAITQGTLSAGSNYTLSYTGANLTINPASLTVTYTANPLTSIYGTVPSGLSGSVTPTGLVLGQTLGSVTSGTAVFTTPATARSPVGSYAITGSGLAANSSNYSFSFVQAPGNATALAINPAALLVAANAQSRTYGASNPVLTYTDTGLVNGDTLTGNLATTATPTSNVGAYAITQGSLSAGSNYTLSYTGANLTINPASLTVTYTANPATSIYGNTPSGLSGSVTPTGLVLGQTLGSVTSGSAVFTTPATAQSPVGSYAITGSGLAANSNNYSFSFVQAPGNATALTIDPAALLVAADAQSRTYGASNPALTYTDTGLVNGDTLTGSLATTATPASNVGAYAITQGTLSAGSNYTLSYTGANLTVNPASLTVTYTANPATSIYGNTPSGLSGSESASGLVNSDTLASVTSGTASFTTPATAQSPVGSYAINGSGLAANSNNYSFSFVQAPGNAAALTIDPAALLVAADAQSRTYGASNPALTYTDTGLVNGDTLTGSLATTATPASNVGNYAITQGTLTAGSNYTLSYTGANLTINPASLTVTYTANPATSIYGNTPSGLSGSESASGLVNSDTLASVTSGTASFTTPATAQSPVGSYAITGSGLAANSSNYSFSFVQAPGNATALAIDPAALLVAADAQSRTYGASNPALTYTDTGLVNGDTLTGNLATGATPASNVGAYAITQGTLTAGSNYTLSYTGANLTINPASLTVTYTANPATSIYGNTPSGLSGSESASGLVNSDTLASVTSGTASFTTPATAQSPVGSYAITGSGLAANSSNYSFSFVQAPGNATALTIDPATLLVAADAQSRTYGASNPALTYTDTGLVNGDTLSGSLATGATPASNVGNYAITQGTLTAGSNYTLSYTGANLTINPASLTVTYTANPLTSIYGTVPSGLSGSVTPTGLVLGQTLGSVTTGSAVFTTPATAQSPVGSYAINGSGLAANSNNYSFSFVQAPGNATALAIAPRPITVLADPQQRQFGAPDPAFTYVVTSTPSESGTTAPGLVNGDQLTGQLAGTDTATSPPGKYDILQGTLAASPNYQLTYVGNFLTVLNDTAPPIAIGNVIEANLPDQPGAEPTPSQRQKNEAAILEALLAGGALHPPQIAQSLINDQLVTTPPPVNEPVTSNGNASLWTPGAP